MKEKSKIATVTTVLSAISLSNTLYDTLKNKYEERYFYTASISAESYVYEVLLSWLNNKLSPKTVKFHSVFKGVSRFYDGTGVSKVDIGGYTLRVTIERPELAKDLSDDIGGVNSMDKMVFSSRDARAIDALENFLVELTEDLRKQERKTYLYSISQYGWNGGDLQGRDIDSVFLPQGVKETLLDDLDTFFENEEAYARIGAPWHRGYLLYGPPGNGKSSLASALASKYRLNLYSLPLSSVKNDRELHERIHQVNENSILLLEDIDIFSKSMSRTQAEADSGPTLAGLLNALDGVGTPHGLLTIMTTNHVETLDPALVRYGRVDRRIELTAPNEYQVHSMFEYVCGEPLGCTSRHFSSMAELANVFKNNMGDVESARLEIKDG